MTDDLQPSFHSAERNPQGARAAIVTDSVAQVPLELTRRLGIVTVPFSLTFEGIVYTDLRDVNLNHLYQRMRYEKDLHLTTSAPSVGMFHETFMECLNQGAESILYIGLSSRLSSAFSTAREAAEMISSELGSQPIFLFDSLLATVAQGFLAIEAARLAVKGIRPEAIMKQLAGERQRTGFAAGLETLEYLARGGRIGKATYLLGNAIRILPVDSIDDNGEVIPVSRKQGFDRVLEEIIGYVGRKITGYQHLSLAVMHADTLIQAKKLQTMAVDRFHPDEIYITDITPTMVAHAGPGIIGLAYHYT